MQANLPNAPELRSQLATLLSDRPATRASAALNMPVTALNTRFQALRVRRVATTETTKQRAHLAISMHDKAYAPQCVSCAYAAPARHWTCSQASSALRSPHLCMQWQAQPTPHKPKRRGPFTSLAGAGLWKQLRRMQVLLRAQDGAVCCCTYPGRKAVLILWGAKHTDAWEAAASLRGGACPARKSRCRENHSCSLVAHTWGPCG